MFWRDRDIVFWLGRDIFGVGRVRDVWCFGWDVGAFGREEDAWF